MILFWGDVALRGGLAFAFAVVGPTAFQERAWFAVAVLTLAALLFASDVAKAVTGERPRA